MTTTITNITDMYNNTSRKSTYKSINSFEKRVKESSNIINKYKDKVPIICEKSLKCGDIPDIDKTKYLVPSDLTVGQFLYVIRKRLKLSPEKAVFIFIDNSIPSSNDTIGIVYKNKKDEDGFLYMTYAGESTFG